jgi:hypothetical protein
MHTVSIFIRGSHMHTVSIFIQIKKLWQIVGVSLECAKMLDYIFFSTAHAQKIG